MFQGIARKSTPNELNAKQRHAGVDQEQENSEDSRVTPARVSGRNTFARWSSSGAAAMPKQATDQRTSQPGGDLSSGELPRCILLRRVGVHFDPSETLYVSTIHYDIPGQHKMLPVRLQPRKMLSGLVSPCRSNSPSRAPASLSSSSCEYERGFSSPSTSCWTCCYC